MAEAQPAPDNISPPILAPDPLMETPSSSIFESSRRELIANEDVVLKNIADLKTKANELKTDIPPSYETSNDFWAIVAGNIPEITKELEENIPDETIREKIALKLAIMSAKEVKTAEDEATIDPLTKAKTRRVLEEEVIHLIHNQRQGSQTGILFVDVDNFKKFNTDYGHPGGDAALVALVDKLKTYVRPSDIVGRYGGEEFVIVLRDIPDAMIASAKAEQIRQAIMGDEALVHIGGQPKKLTISVGVTTIKPSDTTSEQVWQRGSDHVNIAKNIEGRNAVVDDFGTIENVAYTKNKETGKSHVAKVGYRN